MICDEVLYESKVLSPNCLTAFCAFECLLFFSFLFSLSFTQALLQSSPPLPQSLCFLDVLPAQSANPIEPFGRHTFSSHDAPTSPLLRYAPHSHVLRTIFFFLENTRP